MAETITKAGTPKYAAEKFKVLSTNLEFFGRSMKDYRVAIVAPPWYPVPPDGYGGVELVVDLLMRGLRARGIDAVLFAPEGSGHDAVELAPAEWSGDLGQFYGPFREAAYLARVIQHIRTRGFDLIHDHVSPQSPLLFSLLNTPTLHTVHQPVDEPTQDIYRELRQSVGFIAISDSQRSFAPSLNWVGTVHNAVDTKYLRALPSSEKDGYLLSLARISPEKGQHIAIEVARRTGRRLVLAGKVGEREEEHRYFREEIAPHIDGSNVVHYDNVAGAQKTELLSKAYAFLAPVQWPEPFGLSMVEAMVSGTPVLAYNLGSTTELITPGVTGFVAENIDALSAAVRLAEDIDPARCSAMARKRFSPQLMADRYISLYERALSLDNDASDERTDSSLVAIPA